MIVDYTDKGVVWYAMKTTFCRELKAKAILDGANIENFIPMQQRSVVVNGKRKQVVEPAMHNLLFVKCDLKQIVEIKSKVNYLHNMLERRESYLAPIIVPTQEMEQFIELLGRDMKRILYVDITTTNLSAGTRVKIVGGEFEGYDGILMKVKGARDRRVVLNIEGVVAVAMASIDASLIEVLSDSKN